MKNYWKSEGNKYWSSCLVCCFSNAFEPVHQGKMTDIITSYRIQEETIAAITMLYENTKAMVRSLNGDADFFDVLAGVFQGDTLAPFL